MYIRETSETHLRDILSIEQKAFDPENVVDIVIDILMIVPLNLTDL
jgi:hypothetical protein